MLLLYFFRKYVCFFKCYLIGNVYFIFGLFNYSLFRFFMNVIGFCFKKGKRWVRDREIILKLFVYYGIKRKSIVLVILGCIF